MKKIKILCFVNEFGQYTASGWGVAGKEDNTALDEKYLKDEIEEINCMI